MWSGVTTIELIGGDSVQDDEITKARGYPLLVVEWNSMK